MMKRSLIGLLIVFCFLCIQTAYADSYHGGDTYYTTNNKGGEGGDAMSVALAGAKSKSVSKASANSASKSKSKSSSTLTNVENTDKQPLAIPAIGTLNLNVLQNPIIEDITLKYVKMADMDRFNAAVDEVDDMLLPTNHISKKQ
jgi:hypothetical protein